MANQQAKKSPSAKTRASGPSRSQAGHPGQKSRARDSGSHRNPDARPTRAGGGNNKRRPSRSQPDRRGESPAPRPAPSPAEPLGMMGRATNTLGIAGLRAVKGARAAGSVAAESVNGHPTAVKAVGIGLAAAGAALLASRVLLKPSQGDGERVEDGPSLLRRTGDAFGSLKDRVGEVTESLRDGTSRLGEYGRDGLSKVGSGLRSGASAVGSGAEHGYEYTRDALGNLWEEHPLATGAGILALGVVVGMMIPTTRIEQSAFGQTARRLTQRAQSAAGELLEQGRQLADNMVTGTGEAVREMADVGPLSPDKVTRKVKRLANRLKDAVTDAMQD